MIFRFAGGGGAPFAIQNLLPVIFNMKVKNYFFSTLCGLFPTVFILSAIGEGLEKIISEYEINNDYLAGLIEGFYNNFEDSREANQALEKHLISIDNQWTIQDEVDWWEENQQYSIKNWRDSEEYLQLMSEKSQNTLNPDPDFVISDSYPKNVLRKHCDSL